MSRRIIERQSAGLVSPAKILNTMVIWTKTDALNMGQLLAIAMYATTTSRRGKMTTPEQKEIDEKLSAKIILEMLAMPEDDLKDQANRRAMKTSEPPNLRKAQNCLFCKYLDWEVHKGNRCSKYGDVRLFGKLWVDTVCDDYEGEASDKPE